MKYKWKVDPVPTGRYRSFQKRGWPYAEYDNGSPAAWIICADAYRPDKVKNGDHSLLTIAIADYSMPDGNCPWTRKRIARGFRTLADAKKAFKELIESYPKLMPKCPNPPECC